MRRHLSLFSWMLGAASLAYGCSLFNAPDDLLGPATTGGASGTGAASSTGGNGGQGGSGTGGGAVVAPTKGLFVVGAENDSGSRVLLALNTTNGSVLEEVELPIAAVAYDEAPGRFVWFVFTASKFPADPTRTADLEVRRYNDSDNTWTVLSEESGLPPPRPDQLVVLNNRLAYLSYKVVSGTPEESLTVLDTSDLSDVTELATRTHEAGEEYLGLVGMRGSDTNPNADGGALDLMIGRNCTADCELFVQPVFVSDKLVDGAGAVLDHYVGSPRFVAARTEAKVYAAMYSTQPVARVEVRAFAPDAPSTSTLFTIDELTGQDISGFDLLECQNAGLIRGSDSDDLVAFQLESGNRQATDLGTPGDLVYGEPFGGSAITFADPGAGMGGAGSASAPLRAFEVSESGATDLAVNERSLWMPPTDVIPLTGAARYPVTLCE